MEITKIKIQQDLAMIFQCNKIQQGPEYLPALNPWFSITRDLVCFYFRTWHCCCFQAGRQASYWGTPTSSVFSRHNTTKKYSVAKLALLSVNVLGIGTNFNQSFKSRNKLQVIIVKPMTAKRAYTKFNFGYATLERLALVLHSKGCYP